MEISLHVFGIDVAEGRHRAMQSSCSAISSEERNRGSEDDEDMMA